MWLGMFHHPSHLLAPPAKHAGNLGPGFGGGVVVEFQGLAGDAPEVLQAMDGAGTAEILLVLPEVS